MTINDPGKMLLLGVGLVGGIVLAALGQSEGLAVVFTIIGYLTGNGRLALRKEPPSTALSPTLLPEEHATLVSGLAQIARDQATSDRAAGIRRH